jgi:uncharacterized membrane protein
VRRQVSTGDLTCLLFCVILIAVGWLAIESTTANLFAGSVLILAGVTGIALIYSAGKQCQR